MILVTYDEGIYTKNKTLKATTASTSSSLHVSALVNCDLSFLRLASSLWINAWSEVSISIHPNGSVHMSSLTYMGNLTSLFDLAGVRSCQELPQLVQLSRKILRIYIYRNLATAYCVDGGDLWRRYPRRKQYFVGRDISILHIAKTTF